MARGMATRGTWWAVWLVALLVALVGGQAQATAEMTPTATQPVGQPAATPAAPQEGDPSPSIGEPVSFERLSEGAFLELDPAYNGCGGQIAPVVNATYEQHVVELTNLERAKVSLPPLKRVSQLDDAARYYATDMGQDNYFKSDHATYDRAGNDLIFVCNIITRITTFYPNGSLAENIAGGYADPASVMAGWMASAGHRANILNTAVREIGVGYYEGSGDYFRYWVQDFGLRNSVYPLVINREAAITPSTSVSLYIYGAWQEIRLRNNQGAWTAWLPFQNSMPWTLDPVKGQQTVTAEMRNGGSPVTSSDTIIYGWGAYFPIIMR